MRISTLSTLDLKGPNPALSLRFFFCAHCATGHLLLFLSLFPDPLCPACSNVEHSPLRIRKSEQEIPLSFQEPPKVFSAESSNRDRFRVLFLACDRLLSMKKIFSPLSPLRLFCSSSTLKFSRRFSCSFLSSFLKRSPTSTNPCTSRCNTPFPSSPQKGLHKTVDSCGTQPVPCTRRIPYGPV